MCMNCWKVALYFDQVQPQKSKIENPLKIWCKFDESYESFYESFLSWIPSDIATEHISIRNEF